MHATQPSPETDTIPQTSLPAAPEMETDPSPEPPHSEVAEVAYGLWLERGCEHGSDGEDWSLASHIVRTRNSS